MYIRTENHIYLIRKDISYGGNRIYKIYNHDFSIIGNDFKVADTIEELCDEFVLIERNAKPIIFKTLQGAINNKIYDDEIIYGAVWCEFGLKYIAKLNSKGEFELL